MCSSLYQRHYIVSLAFIVMTDDIQLHDIKECQKYTFRQDMSMGVSI